MIPIRTALALFGLAPSFGSCAHLEPRCSEYRQVLSQAHAELVAAGTLRIGAGISETEAIRVSEEGGLLSKRLKTLCELRWEGEIFEDRYHREVRQAYDDYLRTRAATLPLRRGPPAAAPEGRLPP